MNNSPTRLISLAETCSRVGLSRWTVRKQVESGVFPKPVSVGYRATKFVEAEIEGWLAEKIANRN